MLVQVAVEEGSGGLRLLGRWGKAPQIPWPEEGNRLVESLEACEASLHGLADAGERLAPCAPLRNVDGQS